MSAASRARRALLYCAVLAVGAGAAWAETVYRWVDDNGVVNFSSEPRPGAETIDLGPLPTTRFDAPAAEREQAGAAPEGDGATAPEGARPGYLLAIENLDDGQVVWNDARRLELVFDIRPALAAARGHRLEVYVDDERRAVLRDGSRVVLEDIDRGSHRVRAEIVDAGGRVLASSGEITIHHRQHSLATPEPAGSAAPVWMPRLRRIELEQGHLPGDARPPHGIVP